MSARRSPVLIALILLLSAVMEASEKTKGQLGTNEMPMEVYDGYLIVVDGSIGNLYGLKFLLDTGATTSAIDRRLADKLELSGRPTKLTNFDKTLRLEWCEVPQLSYGPEHPSNVKVVVEDLRYFRASGIRVDAVIGWDLLRRQSFRLDFARKRIVFGVTESHESKAVPLRMGALCLTVQVDLDGRPLWMIADTGMRGTTFYEGWLEQMRQGYSVKSRTMGRSVAGAVEFRVALVPPLQLGSQDLDREVYLVHQSQSESLLGIAGYLGIAALQAKEVTFDFERSELTWTK